MSGCGGCGSTPVLFNNFQKLYTPTTNTNTSKFSPFDNKPQLVKPTTNYINTNIFKEGFTPKQPSIFTTNGMFEKFIRK
jgi:hypothetical protein